MEQRAWIAHLGWSKLEETSLGNAGSLTARIGSYRFFQHSQWLWGTPAFRNLSQIGQS